jgi:hypothetical protein
MCRSVPGWWQVYVVYIVSWNPFAVNSVSGRLPHLCRACCKFTAILSSVRSSCRAVNRNRIGTYRSSKLISPLLSRLATFMSAILCSTAWSICAFSASAGACRTQTRWQKRKLTMHRCPQTRQGPTEAESCTSGQSKTRVRRAT